MGSSKVSPVLLLVLVQCFKSDSCALASCAVAQRTIRCGSAAILAKRVSKHSNICVLCPGLSLPQRLRKVLQNFEAWACVANIVKPQDLVGCCLPGLLGLHPSPFATIALTMCVTVVAMLLHILHRSLILTRSNEYQATSRFGSTFQSLLYVLTQRIVPGSSSSLMNSQESACRVDPWRHAVC